MAGNPLSGGWVYRSLNNDPDAFVLFNKLERGVGTIVIDEGSAELLTGTFVASDWSLALRGSRGPGSPARVRADAVVVGQQGGA